MLVIEKAILVRAPSDRAYALWLQFERFPEFMEEIEWVRRLDETRLLWRVNFAGESREWETEVTVRIPHSRISWRSHSGFSNSGTVSFEEREPGRTLVTLGMIFDPAGIGADEQDAKNFLGARLERDLQRFKALLETAA